MAHQMACTVGPWGALARQAHAVGIGREDCRARRDGSKGTLYFECHYIDVTTGKVAAVVGADQNVQKINGKWLIVSSAGATPVLAP